jgi:hypothetical protein
LRRVTEGWYVLFMIDPGENQVFSLLRSKRSIYPDEYVGVFLYFCGIFP